MRDIPTEIINEFLSREYRPFWLIEFTVGTSYYLTDCDVPIAVGGNLYQPRGFKIPTFRYADKQMVDQVTITIDNLDNYFTSNFVGGSPQGQIFRIKQVYLGDDYKPISQVTGPVGHWKLNEAVGDDVADYSGNENLGTLQGTTGLPAWVPWGDTFALDFERANSHWIDLAKPSELAFTARPLAISAWINVESLNANQTIFSKTDSAKTTGGYGLEIGAGANTLEFWVEHYLNNVATKSFTTTGTWVHVLGVWESTGLIQVYVDGIAGTSDSYIGSLTNLDKKACIGAYNDGGAGFWDGLTGNIQIFNRDLTPDEKSTLTAGGYIGPGAILQFEGGIDAWTIDGSQVKLAAKSEMARWTQRPLALHSVSCRWKDFKGIECGYSGAATWCDRTYTRCVELGNSDNFGGFRWLPSIMDKEFWWGKIPK